VVELKTHPSSSSLTTQKLEFVAPNSVNIRRFTKIVYPVGLTAEVGGLVDLIDSLVITRNSTAADQKVCNNNNNSEFI